MIYNFEEIKQRILESLEILSKHKKKELCIAVKMYWYGFLFGLADYLGITEEDYRRLVNMVTSY